MKDVPVSIDESVEGYRIIRVDEYTRIDMENSPFFRSRIMRYHKEKTDREYCFDLSKVHYLDSSGLAVLIEFYQSIEKMGKKELDLIVDDDVKTLLVMTRWDTIFSVHDSYGKFLEKKGLSSEQII